MIQWFLYIITAVLIYKWLNRKPKGFPPGPPTIPVLGSLPFINSTNFHFELEDLREKYGPVIGLKFGPIPAVAVCGPNEVIEVLKREDFSGRPKVVTENRRNGQQGVFFANGEHWKDQRRFALRHLKDFGFGKTTVADMVQEEFQEFCEKKLKNNHASIQISGLFNICATNVIWAMIGGTRLSYEDEELKMVLRNLEKLFRQGNVTQGVINTVPGLKKLISLFYEIEEDKFDRLLKEFFMKAVKYHKATKTTESPRDLLDVYLTELENPNKKPSFSEETLHELCRDLFAAGTESSSNTVSFAIMYLLRHPDWQKKLQDEVDEVLAGRAPAIDDHKRLPVVEAFLAEVLRCNTIAPISVPRATTKDTYLNGYFIPEGSFTVVSIWTLLQDKKHWGDPENFRPERFLNPEGQFVKDPYMFIFGAGPRVCLGESLARNFVFIFFVSLIQKYSFFLPKGHSPPATKCLPGFTTAPQPFEAVVTVR